MRTNISTMIHAFDNAPEYVWRGAQSDDIIISYGHGSLCLSDTGLNALLEAIEAFREGEKKERTAT